MKKLLSVVLMMTVGMAVAQEKEERMKRDVEVAENVLSTLIRQQLEKRSSFWPMEVKGFYTAGFGVTLRIPYESWSYIVGNVSATIPAVWGVQDPYNSNGGVTVTSRDREEDDREEGQSGKDKLKAKRSSDRDSARNAYGERILEAAKIFLADYGDLMGLEPNEKILITTKSERGGNYSFAFAGDINMKEPKRKVISVEAVKADLSQYKQGKISRDQLMSKFKVLSEVNDEVQPDLELLSTIFNRLYRSDLSKTYFMEGTPYYERMKDFGVTYFMQVYSSNEAGYDRFNMPTQNLKGLSQEERDKKVKELYPSFEKDLKENMLDYGRTIGSLKDDELLIFDVTLTKCRGCGIPSTVEFSVKASVLKEFGAGKLAKDVAVGKINVKRGNPQ